MIATLTFENIQNENHNAVLKKSTRPFIWHKTWGVNQKASQGVAEKPNKNGHSEAFSSFFSTFMKPL